jgi:hypothetical protein
MAMGCAQLSCVKGPINNCVTTKEGVAQNIDTVQPGIVRTRELYRGENEWVCI